MDATQIPHTFVRTVKAQDLCFNQVDDLLEAVKTKASPTWVILAFADPRESRNTMKPIATGDDNLSDQSKWPSELFAPNTLCYGFARIEYDEDNTFPPSFVSFCWKGRSLPIYLRTKYTEFNHVIRKHLGAITHVTLQSPEELIEGSILRQVPQRRPRCSSRRNISNEIEVATEVAQTVKDIRSDSAPFNWVVCGYETLENEKSKQKLVVIEKGMSGLYALKGIGGITSVLQEGPTMYIYLRVDIPLHRGTDRIVSKYVLVTWQGSELSPTGFNSDDEADMWNAPPLSPYSDAPPSSTSRDSFNSTSSKIQRALTAHVLSAEISRVFPHHVHFFASSLSEITEESIRDRVRRAVDNDCMLLRVVCIQASGDTQPPVCLEIPFDANVGVLRKEIAANIGIPENRQRIVWIRQTDEFKNEAQQNSKAIMLDDDEAGIRKDIGLGHGDKIHVDDKDNGENSVLAKLYDQINSGTASVSLSAERRHEVQRGVEAREAELQKILSVTNYLLRRKASKEFRPAPPLLEIIAAANARSNNRAQIVPVAEEAVEKVPEAPSSVSTVSLISEDLGQDVSNLEEQARVLEAQNQYLDIPYESIRILGGKENELGCGKAATVYRGVWMSRNGAAEVAVKSFRYVRLTDKILGDYTQEVAMLRKLKHPNIVLFIGACTNPKLLILTEYCSRKSLYEVIHSNNFETIPWKFKVRMMLDAARGIQYLHSKRIIHRDIKSHNFLVDDDWRVKVADFGISKVLDNDTAFTQCGTTGWVAPEVLLDEDLGYTFKADNWSFAIVMWEMIADGNQNPFIGMAPIKFYNQTIHSGIRPPIPEGVEPDYVSLISECWSANADDRPSFDHIVSCLERILLNLGASIDLPPAFQGGYHQGVLTV
uniref:Protein kinase domain-containing protein n=1 Tax=Globisporangium ultimum (strain ATCC 200006 / CBS 805.95 / DAOM BR144) TaxID=431595 RepID=K3WK92_GLOUD